MALGEGWTSYASPRALAATIEDDVAPLVVGRGPSEARDLVETMRAACVMSGRYGISAVAASAVEIALWDLVAKIEGVPLYRLLGGASPNVPVYASGGLYRAEDDLAALCAEMAGYVAAGYGTVKMKVGGAPLDTDIARVAAARDAIGADTTLLVDAHYTMDVDAALAFAEAAEPHGVAWLEAPILPTDWEGHATLAARSPIPLCGNETLPWRDGFARLADAGVRYVMPDVSACGGIAETLAIAAQARGAGAQVTLHSSSSVVLYAASLHVAAAVPGIHSVECHMMHRWLFDRVDAAFSTATGGVVTLPETPGHGAVLTPDDL